jgi:hypothetical protein
MSESLCPKSLKLPHDMSRFSTGFMTEKKFFIKRFFPSSDYTGGIVEK